MNPRRGNPSGAEKTAPTWVKALVGFHVFVTIIWTLPNPPTGIMEGTVQPRATQWLLLWDAKYLKSLNPVRAYMFGTGAWQYWDMFAPDPSWIDWYCTVDVQFKDGSKGSVVYPRIYDLPIPEKYIKERFRKFYERARDSNTPFFWPPFAQAMALQAFKDKSNPPLVVTLKLHKLIIVAPGKPQPKEYETITYFSYAVDQRRLLKDAGGS